MAIKPRQPRSRGFFMPAHSVETCLQVKAKLKLQATPQEGACPTAHPAGARVGHRVGTALPRVAACRLGLVASPSLKA